ncbi:hypothetical protein D7B24_007782 [Verticillium nonalfalfae]|uniref:Type 1 phosphatases regulator n=1 Tax=Verticillium nonalfalfae TaxID=1051616 RepID=A0A3M9Y673_9PEZI|nr:uncharacterized protein D7B24_007782 [Verticillium nonalfalfae]RNJ56003.1 hypothetical protein D7B24_007782 [Verticillium nonalfalfae]
MASAAQRPPQRGSPAPSQTQTVTTAPVRPNTHQTTLRLRGAHAPARPSVQWADDVVDNEGLGRKKSKVCCIYHRPKGIDESSDESSSDSSSDGSDSENESGRRRVPDGDSKGKGKGKGKAKPHQCDDHDHNHDHAHHHGRADRRGGDKGKEKRLPSPNAYERIPKPPKAKNDQGENTKK